MKEIKTKEFVDAQEVFEGVIDLGDRMRRGLGRGGDYARNLADDGQVSSTEYASDQLQYGMEDICYESGHLAVDMTKRAGKGIRKGVDNIREHRREQHEKPDEPDMYDPVLEPHGMPHEDPQAVPNRQHPANPTEAAKLSEGPPVDKPRGKAELPQPSAKAPQKVSDVPHPSAKSLQKIPDTPQVAQATHRSHIAVRQTAQNTGKATVKTTQSTIKESQKAIKAAQEATQATIKTYLASAKVAQQAARVATEAARRTAELLREAAKAAAEAVKVAAKAIAAAAKAVAAAIEEIAGAIAAGGWVALVIIAVIIIIIVIIMAVIGYLDSNLFDEKVVPPCL